jgi:DNA modification methylase
MKSNIILQGDVLVKLKELKNNSIDCVVTSPPYWGLRDYGHENQIGLENTPEEYVEKIVEIFREVKRVLKNDGTLWLNLGDSYAGNNSRASNNGRAGYGNKRETVTARFGNGLKNKDLVGIPWRVAFALQADGWYLRQDIIWAKPNPIPESVKDRCTKSHEYLFLLTKQAKYYFDNEAIKEDTVEKIKNSKKKFGGNKYSNSKDPKHQTKSGNIYKYNSKRNKRDVWFIPPKPFKEAHFAVMPEALVEPCILAGSKKGDIVLDPFLGSGTVALVAKKHNRKYIGIEINPDYIKIAEKRLS